MHVLKPDCITPWSVANLTVLYLCFFLANSNDWNLVQKLVESILYKQIIHPQVQDGASSGREPYTD